MITLKVVLGILAIAAVLWAWAYFRDRIGDSDTAEQTIPPELME